MRSTLSVAWESLMKNHSYIPTGAEGVCAVAQPWMYDLIGPIAAFMFTTCCDDTVVSFNHDQRDL